jgi:hypothetical protein
MKIVANSLGEITPELLEKVQSKIHAPYVVTRKTPLSGDGIWVTLSLQPKDQWTNGIFENSPGIKVFIQPEGYINSSYASSFWKDGQLIRLPKFRKTTYKTIDDAITKINAWIETAKAKMNEANEESSSTIKANNRLKNLKIRANIARLNNVQLSNWKDSAEYAIRFDDGQFLKDSVRGTRTTIRQEIQKFQKSGAEHWLNKSKAMDARIVRLSGRTQKMQ